MAWTDKGSIRIIKELRDIFKVKTFVETGTFKGINAKFHSKNFNTVLTCEKNVEYFKIAHERLSDIDNVEYVNQDSSEFLKILEPEKEPIMFYLDAHFYNPEAKDKWVVLKELKALKDFKNCIIIIHDFDNNLGHITYDGQPLNLELLKEDLMKVNPNFILYTNELKSCDPLTPNYTDILKAGLEIDAETLDNIEYAWSKPEKTYRGFLYAVTREVEIDGIKRIN